MSLLVAPSSHPYAGQARGISNAPTDPLLFSMLRLVAGAESHEWRPPLTLFPSASFLG
jgi:hypothetical protein